MFNPVYAQFLRLWAIILTIQPTLLWNLTSPPYMDNNDVYIITLVIESHGKVIDLNYSDPNVRLFHKSGTFQTSYTEGNQYDIENIQRLERLLRKDLKYLTLWQLKNYEKEERERYRKFIQKHNVESNVVNTIGYPIFNLVDRIYPKNDLRLPIVDETQICNLEPILRFDKMYGKQIPIPGSSAGYHIISIHKKNKPNEYELVYPTKSNQKTNLIFLENWRDLLRVFQPSEDENEWIKTHFIDKDEISQSLGKYEKEVEIENIKTPYISGIRLSYLIQCLRDIIPNVRINLIDNTCSNLLPGLKPESPNHDIENPKTIKHGKWGGIKTRKRIKKRKPYRKNSRNRRI